MKGNAARSLGLVFIVLMLAFRCANGAEPGAALKPVRIAVTVNGLIFYPAYVARAAGFFKEEGLDDQWLEIGGGASTSVAALMGGQADVVLLGIDNAISASMKGADIVAFAGLLNAYALTIVLSSDAYARKGINPGMTADEKLNRIKGLAIGVTTVGGGPDEMIRNTLRVRGIDPDKDIEIRPLGTADAMLAALSKHLIDGMVTTSPYSEIAEEKGFGKILVSGLTGDLPELRGVPYTAALTTNATIRRDPDMVLHVTRALAKAMRLTRNDPQKAKELIRRYFPTLDADIYSRMEASFRGISATTTLIDRGGFQRFVAWKNIAAKGAYQASFEKAVNTEFAAKADAEILGKR